MKNLIRLICLLSAVALSPPARSEVGARDLTLAGLSDCVKEAMGAGSIEDAGGAVVLSCNAEKAKVLFNFLGKKVSAEVVQDKNGKFENRAFGNNACYRRIEDASGKSANDFRCDLILVIGDALKD